MSAAIPLPGHAYVPGQTPRHADGAFDALRGSVRKGMAPEALAGTEAFRAGLAFLDAGYFWEAHEVLEPVWMACPPASAERHLVQGLIQLANAGLKARMGRPGAVARLCALARGHVDEAALGGHVRVMGQDLAGLLARIDVLSKGEAA
jgi:hypothetical protein